MYRPGFLPVPPMISVFTPDIGWVDEQISGLAPTSTSWEASQRAVYCPITLPGPCTVRRVWWANGATVSGGATIEVGVYADSGYGPGAKLVSGSATQGTANEIQFVDVTDTTIGPGLYWLAITSSTATNTTVMRSAAGSLTFVAAVRFNEDSAQPLPSTATPAEAGNTNIYLCGFATTASP